MTLPLIAVTMGDPAGIGPEVCLQLLADPSVREFAIPVIFGDARIASALREADRFGATASHSE